MMFTRIEQDDHGDSWGISLWMHNHACSRTGEQHEARTPILDGIADPPSHPFCVESGMYLDFIAESEEGRRFVANRAV